MKINYITGAYYLIVLIAIYLVLSDVYKRKENCTVNIEKDHIHIKGNNCNYVVYNK